MTKIELNIGDFKNIQKEDIPLLKEFLGKYEYQTCDYNLLNLYCWGHFLDVRWAVIKDRLFLYNFSTGFMLFPLGSLFSTREMICLSDKMIGAGMRGHFISVPEFYAVRHKCLINHFDVIEDVANSDYVYTSEQLAELPGRKLHKKKNLISQFRRIYGEYSAVPFKKKDSDLCTELARRWGSDHRTINDDEKELELKVMCRAMEHSEELGLEGLMIYHEGKLIAFSLFSRLNSDTVDVHFEKYDFNYKGSSQLINRETAVFLKDRYKYINREQDMGKKGLRKAKESYIPDMMIPTYRLIRK